MTLDIIPWGCVNSPTRDHRTRKGAFVCAYIPQPVDLLYGLARSQAPRNHAGMLRRPGNYNNLRDLGDQAGGPARGKEKPRGGLGFFLCSSFSGMIYSFFVISSLAAASYALPYFCFVYCWPWCKKPTSTVWSIFFYVLFPYSNILHITVSVAVSAYFTFIHLHPSFLFLFGGVGFACLAPHVFAKGDAFGAGPLHNGFIFFLAKSNRALNPLICGRFAPRIEALTAFGCHMVSSFNTYIRREYNQFPGCRKAFP